MAGIVCRDLEEAKTKATHLISLGTNFTDTVRKFSSDMAAFIDAGANIAAVAGVINELGSLADTMTETLETTVKQFEAYLGKVQEIGETQISMDEE